jgi:uncharacterized protein YjaZ
VVSATSLTACDGDPAPTPPPQVRGVRVEIDDEVRRAAADAGVDVERAVHRAVARTDRRIEVPITTIEVVARPNPNVPDAAVSGFANPGTGDVTIFLEPARAGFEEALSDGLPEVLAHELHHAVRIVDGPGYGDSLTEAIVTEGLAEVFTLEVFPDPKAGDPPRGTVCRWWARARALRGRPYDHGEWFHGSGEIPIATGYSVGYAIVRDHLRRHPSETAADLVTTPARRIVRGSRLCR